MKESKHKEEAKVKTVENELDSVQRLFLEKKELIQTNKKETLIRDQKIQELQGMLAMEEDNKNRLMRKLDDFENRIVPELLFASNILKGRIQELQESMDICANRVTVLLNPPNKEQSQQSIDANQLLEDFKKLDKANHNHESKLESSYRSYESEFSSRVFEINSLEEIIHALERVWTQTQEKLKINIKQIQHLQEQNKLLKQQHKSFQEDQTRLRNQCTSLQGLLKQTEISRKKISEQILNDVDNACKNAKIDIQKISTADLRRNVGILAARVEQYRQKIDKLQEQLYISREQSTSNLQMMTSSISKVKEQKENELRKKEKEILQLKNLLGQK